jgi:hypothetical protein
LMHSLTTVGYGVAQCTSQRSLRTVSARILSSLLSNSYFTGTVQYKPLFGSEGCLYVLVWAPKNCMPVVTLSTSSIAATASSLGMLVENCLYLFCTVTEPESYVESSSLFTFIIFPPLKNVPSYLKLATYRRDLTL